MGARRSPRGRATGPRGERDEGRRRDSGARSPGARNGIVGSWSSPRDSVPGGLLTGRGAGAGDAGVRQRHVRAGEGRELLDVREGLPLRTGADVQPRRVRERRWRCCEAHRAGAAFAEAAILRRAPASTAGAVASWRSLIECARPDRSCEGSRRCGRAMRSLVRKPCAFSCWKARRPRPSAPTGRGARHRVPRKGGEAPFTASLVSMGGCRMGLPSDSQRSHPWASSVER